MGKQRLGDFIRKIDFLKAKDSGDYEDSDDNPSNQLTNMEGQYEDMSFDDFKDALAAFEEKICIKGFPERHTPAYWVAYTTACVLDRLSGYVTDDDPEMTRRVSSVFLHAIMALVKAGPNSTHCELLEKFKTSEVEEYAQSLGQKDLIPIMAAAKVRFKYTPAEDPSEHTYGSLQNDALERYFLMFSTEQYKLVQKEFLDTYIHYHSQIPGLTETYAQQIYYMVRGIVGNFEDENPYLHLKDPGIIKKHLSILKDMVCSEGFGKGGPEDAVEMTLENIMKAVLKDNLVNDVYDHMVTVIIDMTKDERAREAGSRIYDMYRRHFYKQLEDHKFPIAKIFKSSLNLVTGILAIQKGLTEASTSLLEGVVSDVIAKVKTVSAEDMKLVLTMVISLLNSGKKDLVNEARRTIEATKKSKSLDWKKHIDEAKKIMEVVGEIPKERMDTNKEGKVDPTVREYKDFMRDMKDQLKRAKVLEKLQSNITSFFFNCLLVSTPVKAELAEDWSSSDYMDFSKDKQLRQEVLKKIHELVKQDHLPWDNRDLARSVSKVLRIVVDSYDENGKNVTAEENEHFMSIFKYSGQGSDSVEEQFYEEEDNEIPNMRFNIWTDVLMNYVRLHQESRTLGRIAPIMPEVLRWSKIALKEDHEQMINVTFGILSWVGIAAPVEFKDSLAEFVDIMLVSEKCQDLYSLVNALYPHNPTAVHNRLQDMFDSLDDLKDSQRHIVMSLFHTVGQSHPEAFTKPQISRMFELYKEGNDSSRPLLLIIIRSIGEKHPENLADFFPQLCDASLFKPDSLNLRSGILCCVGGVNEKLGQKTVDYLMKYADNSNPTTSHIVMGTLSSMVRQHKDYMQKHKPKLEKIETTSTNPQVKDLAHDMILVLEGKSAENIMEGMQQQQGVIAELDTKVDTTIDTVITIGDTVVKHDKDIGKLEEGLDRVDERVDDVEEDLGETKLKVEEVDNKTMTNAPKWSRDLTKLMNPSQKNDWRLLASRLGYSNDDIRSWATQHDPCMALLSEWYATHKTSEASFGVLTALTEMNRMDGVAIVENAMKSAEGVVEDEDFEYPSPPAVFLSYQWGVQNEVKLLKQHLNMAGYECWMDIGQMGGGDKLFSKIDNGIRGAKVVICCVTEKYAQSPNCNREVNLSVNLNKPIIPLLMEKTDWPPKGSMGPIFSEYLFIRFFQRGGEETGVKDQRYWPIPKFQELLMQLNFYAVPDQKMVKKEYASWWAPIVEDIVIDKNKGKKQTTSKKPQQNASQAVEADKSPLVFLSYQWGKQPQVKALYQRLTSLGYTVWMDIYQMGGGDSLYDKIDRGMRGCKAVVSCVTQKYSLSANCRREVSLADALKKPIIPLMLEQIKWPPDGPMSMVFTELLYINFYRDESVQSSWKGEQFDELMSKLGQFVPIDEGKVMSANGGKGNRKDSGNKKNATTTGTATKGPSANSPNAKGENGSIKAKTEASPKSESSANTVIANNDKVDTDTRADPGNQLKTPGKEKEPEVNQTNAKEPNKSKSCLIL